MNFQKAMKCYRRIARELALQALYAIEMGGNSIVTVLQEQIRQRHSNKTVVEFAEKVTQTVLEHVYQCDLYVRKKATNWDFRRIAIIDRLLLRMAVCEFLFFDDIPPKVSIDEAIEIGKKYSTEKSGRFINGILDAILDDLKNTNYIHKKGRGLIESTTSAKNFKKRF